MSRLPTGRAWDTHDLRHRTILLVRTGLDLMRGGYLDLLLPAPPARLASLLPRKLLKNLRVAACLAMIVPCWYRRFVGETFADAALRSGALRRVPIHLPARPFFVVRHRERYHCKAADAFLLVVRDGRSRPPEKRTALDANEISDKRCLYQCAVVTRRTNLVERLHVPTPDPEIIVAHRPNRRAAASKTNWSLALKEGPHLLLESLAFRLQTPIDLARCLAGPPI